MTKYRTIKRIYWVRRTCVICLKRATVYTGGICLACAIKTGQEHITQPLPITDSDTKNNNVNDGLKSNFLMRLKAK